MSGNETIVKFLLENPDITADQKVVYAQGALYQSAPIGKETILKALLAVDGVNVNGQRSTDGKTPLHIATNSGRKWAGSNNMVELLLYEYRADPNIKDNHGRGVLSDTADINWGASALPFDIEVVQLLLATDNVGLESRDPTDRIPLHLAVLSAYTILGFPKKRKYLRSLIKHLLKRGAGAGLTVGMEMDELH